MKNRHLLGTTALCAITVSNLFAFSVARAQDAAAGAAPASTSSSKVEEITVTARQRSETQVDAPISMQVFTEDQIKAGGITDLNALQFKAGFTFQEAASTQAGGREFPALIMRGLQSTYGGGQDNSGSLFLDGIYISAGQASINTADVRQIEVLKGPQNVYFGKNSFGGAINFITSNPSDTFGGEVDASGSMRGSTNFNAMLEGPLLPGQLDARINVQNYNKVAQYHATDGGDLGAESTKSVTATLYGTPSSKGWFRVRTHYQQDDDSAADLGFIPGSVYGSNCAPGTGSGTTANGTPVTITLAAPYFCGSIPSLGQTGAGVLDQNTAIPAGFASALATNTFPAAGSYLLHDPVLAQVPSLNHSGLRRDLLQASGQGGYDLPYNLNLAGNVGYNESQSLAIWDLDRSPNGIFINAQPIASTDLTLDGKLSTDPTERLRGLVGASYFHSTYQLSQDGYNFYNYTPLSAFFGGAGMSNYTNETDDIKAVYGSVDFDIFSWLTATAEARYQHDEIQDTTVTGTSYSSSFNNILPRFILKLHPEKSWDFYTSYSEGVQPAELQTGYINANAAQRAYLASVVPGASTYSPLAKLKSWEVGAKQELFDGRLIYGLALYDEKWDNQQTTAAVFNPAACGLTQLTAACPLATSGSFLYLSNNADVKGIEFNGTAKLLDRLTADFAIDYKRAVWLNYYNSTLSTFTGGVTHFNGNELARVPALSGFAAATWRDHLAGNWDWYARGEVTYTGSMYESDVNIAKTNAFARFNGSIGFTKGDLTLELWAKNLFDNKDWDFASRVPELGNATDLFSGYSQYMGVLVQAPDRRDIGVKLSYKF